jgi:hypothetical protein
MTGLKMHTRDVVHEIIATNTSKSLATRVNSQKKHLGCALCSFSSRVQRTESGPWLKTEGRSQISSADRAPETRWTRFGNCNIELWGQDAEAGRIHCEQPADFWWLTMRHELDLQLRPLALPDGTGVSICTNHPWVFRVVKLDAAGTCRTRGVVLHEKVGEDGRHAAGSRLRQNM